MGDNETQAAAIAAQLHESEAEPVQQICRALERCGPDLVQGLLAETLAIEAQGGQWVADGSRRRTAGGVFFRLLHERISLEDWRHIRGVTAPPAPPPAQPLAWAERGPSAQAALAQPGTASAARLTVVGRPREVKDRDGMMIVTVDGGEALPALPRGLPSPAHAATTYKILLGEAAWRRVEAGLSRPAALLIADGYAVPNLKAGTVTLLARFATVKPAPPDARPGVMRIQLTGRPGPLIQQGATVLTALTSRQAPRLPEGVPDPPPVTYLVYSAEKQWRLVAAAGVQIDGYCLYDAELKALTVLTQRVTARAERPAPPGPGRRP